MTFSVRKHYRWNWSFRLLSIGQNRFSFLNVIRLSLEELRLEIEKFNHYFENWKLKHVYEFGLYGLMKTAPHALCIGRRYGNESRELEAHVPVFLVVHTQFWFAKFAKLLWNCVQFHKNHILLRFFSILLLLISFSVRRMRIVHKILLVEIIWIL